MCSLEKLLELLEQKDNDRDDVSKESGDFDDLVFWADKGRPHVWEHIQSHENISVFFDSAYGDTAVVLNDSELHLGDYAVFELSNEYLVLNTSDSIEAKQTIFKAV